MLEKIGQILAVGLLSLVLSQGILLGMFIIIVIIGVLLSLFGFQLDPELNTKNIIAMLQVIAFCIALYVVLNPEKLKKKK